MVVETLFGGQPSIDNPPTVIFSALDIGDSFTHKGDRCVVKSVATNKRGFWFDRNGITGYMSFAFYMSTPSAAGRRLQLL